jgi:uncharacterized OB-fold protein
MVIRKLSPFKQGSVYIESGWRCRFVPQLSDVFKQTIELADSKRPLAAIEKLEWLSAKLSEPAALTLVRYNCGCLLRSAVGNGVRARACLIQATEQAAKVTNLHDSTKTLWANACENLMLLSLSYEDYEHWADELKRLHPAADILRGQVPKILDRRDRGIPWSQAMAGMAEGYYSRSDPQHDAGMYGDAASTYQLLLAHRKELRLGREDWKRAINEYGRLCLRLSGDTAVAAEKQNPMTDPSESVPIVTDALPLVDEYLKANPNDDLIKEMRRSMEAGARALTELREPPPILEPEEVFGMSHESEFVSGRVGCPKCGYKLRVPAIKCPKCGHQFVSMGVNFLKGVVAGLVVLTVLRYGFSSAPRWLAPLAAVVSGFLVYMFTTIKAVTQVQLEEAVAPKSAARQRQDRIDDIMGWQRSTQVLCRNGHQMKSFEDEGVLLAACPTCGIVKPYPGTMALMTDINRVAGKYDNFDL